jgi:hypothetical protein
MQSLDLVHITFRYQYPYCTITTHTMLIHNTNYAHTLHKLCSYTTDTMLIHYTPLQILHAVTVTNTIVPFHQDCIAEIIAAGAACPPPAAVKICAPPNASSVPPISSLGLHTSAAWDLLTWLHALAMDRDGGLRWSLAEKSYAHSVREQEQHVDK